MTTTPVVVSRTKSPPQPHHPMYSWILVLLVDIDECAEGTDRCEHFCHNNVGSYSCSCRVGFRLNRNGFNCDGKLVTQTCKLFCYLSLLVCLCLDINECLPGGVGTALCHQVCNNTIGSFFCSCHLGFRLTADNITCTGQHLRINVEVLLCRNCSVGD